MAVGEAYCGLECDCTPFEDGNDEPVVGKRRASPTYSAFVFDNSSPPDEPKRILFIARTLNIK